MSGTEVIEGDLTDAQIIAAKNHLRDMLRAKGHLSGCISYNQRKMGIGWSVALRIVEYLIATQFITEPTASGVYCKGPAWTDDELA